MTLWKALCWCIVAEPEAWQKKRVTVTAFPSMWGELAVISIQLESDYHEQPIDGEAWPVVL